MSIKEIWKEDKGLIICPLVLVILFLYVLLFNGGIICFPDCDGCTPKYPCGVTIFGMGDSARVTVTKGEE